MKTNPQILIKLILKIIKENIRICILLSIFYEYEYEWIII